MKKTMILVYMFFLYGNIICQNNNLVKSEFHNYVNLFQNKNLPITIPKDYYKLEKSVNDGGFIGLKNEYVKKYILNNEKANWDTTCIKYQHLYCIAKNDKFIALIYSKSNLEPPITEGLNLFETFLIIYDKEGKIMSRLLVTQESERRFMTSEINQDFEIILSSVYVKNKGINWPKTLNVEIKKEKYHITQMGIIEKNVTLLKKQIKVDKEKTFEKILEDIK